MSTNAEDILLSREGISVKEGGQFAIPTLKNKIESSIKMATDWSKKYHETSINSFSRELEKTLQIISEHVGPVLGNFSIHFSKWELSLIYYKKKKDAANERGMR